MINGKTQQEKDKDYRTEHKEAFIRYLLKDEGITFEEILASTCSLPLIKSTLKRLESSVDLFADTSDIIPVLGIRRGRRVLMVDVADYCYASTLCDDKERARVMRNRFERISGTYQSCLDELNLSQRLFLSQGVIDEAFPIIDYFRKAHRTRKQRSCNKESIDTLRRLNFYLSKVLDMFDIVRNGGRLVSYDHRADDGRLYVLLDDIVKKRSLDLSPVDKEVVLSAAQHSLDTYERPTVVLSRDKNLLIANKVLSREIITDREIIRHYGDRPLGYAPHLSGLSIPPFGGVKWYGKNPLPPVERPKICYNSSEEISDILLDDASSTERESQISVER